jgi:hypothetical protein
MFTVDEPLSKVMVPECIYRGFCPEYKSCGFSHSPRYKYELGIYQALNGRD